MVFPDFSYETPLWDQGYTVIGIDEVGRGAFAGPVGIGGAVLKNITDKDREYVMGLGINDSKKLSAKKRLALYEVLKQVCDYSVEFVDVPTINKIGIGKATFLGMKRVAEKIASSQVPRNDRLFTLVDAFEIPGLKIPQKGIVRGDSLSVSIAAASILAKVERDRLMEELGLKFGNYGFVDNKGYGTKFHRDALRVHGSTPHHRTDFISSYI